MSVHSPSSPPAYRAETEQMLIKARQDQIHHKEHFLAVQAQRDRDEFERVLRSAIMKLCSMYIESVQSCSHLALLLLQSYYMC